MSEPYSFGLEEEYFLVHAESKELTRAAPDVFFSEVKEAAGERRVAREFLRSQVEVISSPHNDMDAARAEMRELRQIIDSVAAKFGLSIVAAGTHPTATWRDQQQTEGERYDTIMHDLQMIGQRDLLCGLHVHIELHHPDARIDVMYRMLPYLPLFIALATSSPFWQSRRTGLLGYRLAAYDELPRTGIPELFRTPTEYDAYVEALVRAGVMENSSYVWWIVRPSLKHPTLELRASDTCTRLSDTMAIVALFRALAHHIVAHPWLNWELDAVARAIAVENKWRAQRYGVHGTFVTPNGGVGVAEIVDRLVDEIAPSARALGCVADLEHCRAIAAQGTSADRQLAIYDEAIGAGGSRTAALAAVLDWLGSATMA